MPTQTNHPQDWDARSSEVLTDQVAAYDALRARCPVAWNDDHGWTVLGHADVRRVLEDHEAFSSAVSKAHPAVPNGYDPPRHTAYRALVDRYFTPARMDVFAPELRAIAAALVDALPRGEAVDVMPLLGDPFALRVQTRWLGWPESLEEPLREWTRANHEATLAGDRPALDALGRQFDGYILELLDARRAARADAPDDITTELLAETVDGRPVTDAEIFSILRNWTVGELGTIAASIGIVVEQLARDGGLQAGLRRAPAQCLAAASDEMLRINPPLVSNRRVATRDVELGGRQVTAGERVTVLWASALRDEQVFGDPDAFRPDENADANLLYGRGIHDCPGAPLARLELAVFLEELLARTTSIELADAAVPAAPPAGGFDSVRVVVR